MSETANINRDDVYFDEHWGVDLDDTVVRTVKKLLKRHNRKGNRLTLRDLYHADADSPVFAELHENVKEYQQTPSYLDTPPTPDALDVLPWMSGACKGLYLVTGRGVNLAAPTEAIAELYFPGVFRQVIVTGWFSDQGAATPKEQIYLLRGISRAWDDLMTHARNAAKVGIRAGVIDRYGIYREDRVPVPEGVELYHDFYEVKQGLVEEARAMGQIAVREATRNASTEQVPVGSSLAL
ncbi:hypothetical protein HY346_02580 [Candidatus Microgenomates bacterium]|nr:hypothetical protein [Candidatus Microgenomates bacterium]